MFSRPTFVLKRSMPDLADVIRFVLLSLNHEIAMTRRPHRIHSRLTCLLP